MWQAFRKNSSGILNTVFEQRGIMNFGPELGGAGRVDTDTVRITRTGTEPLRIGDQTIASQRYTLLGPDLHIDLYYSERGEWLALDAPTKNGRTLRYRLERLSDCASTPSNGNKQEACA